MGGTGSPHLALSVTLNDEVKYNEVKSPHFGN